MTQSDQFSQINRRSFLIQSGVLATAALVGLASFKPKPKYRMGLQLFTIREPLSKDPKGTFKKVATLGYENLETYGFDAIQKKYYGYDVKEFRKVLEDLNLATTSGHYDLNSYLGKPNDDLIRYVDQCIEGAKELNQKYITWPWLDPQSRTIEKFKLVAEKLNVIGERVKKAKLSVAYHNHDFEFIDQNGEIGYDIIMNETDASLVKLQIDLYWVMHSSRQTPHELFSKEPGRFVMWHVKDMDKVRRDYTELGNGSIDYKVILPDTKLAGMEEYFIEQGGNFATDPMKSIADSAVFMKQNLEKYL
ncbi:MAG TPA: sugar phosphate isomerase/epimerase [Chryseolinea sp.]|nr:sugar phosphate isomerase/epimerase [Chryseolinea sp.]HPM29650.1 sugar phosphate isomerase/epimerase [Chryseolinea sp.]